MEPVFVVEDAMTVTGGTVYLSNAGAADERLLFLPPPPQLVTSNSKHAW
jgi:hypothetical protein